MGILLVIIITVSCILFVLYTRRLRKKKAELEAEKAEVNAWQNDMNLYDNIELNGSGSGGKRLDGDGIYEVYEHVDDQYTTVGNEYTPYNDPGYSNYSYTTMMNDSHSGSQHYGNLGIRNSLGGGAATYEELTDGANTDYVRMLRDSRVPFAHALQPTGSVQARNQGGRVIIVRKDSGKKLQDAEPSYLEISK